MNQRGKYVLFNSCIALNCLLVVLLLFGSSIQVPAWLQVAGRMHPLMVHFPIVLLLLAFVWELFVSKKGHTLLAEMGDWMLLSATFTAVLAALMGFFLSKETGYDEDAIAWHQWTGVFIAWVSMAWYGFRAVIRKRRITTTVTGIAGVAVVVLAGHQGAGITHGENFLLSPVTVQKKSPTVLLEEAIVYTHLVKPVLQQKCVSCHNSKKAKGELIMETEALLLKGGKNGKLWDSTKAGFGLMMHRLHLPLDMKEHMPPAGKPQLLEEEITILYNWIKSGASFTKKITDYPETDTLYKLAARIFKTVESDSYDFEAANEEAVKKLNTDYRVVKPLALYSPALGVDFFGPAFYNSSQLKELEKVKDNIVSINLSKMPVTDTDIKALTAFGRLRKLNLSFTNITGAGLQQLAGLPELRHLSIAGTKLKSDDLAPLVSLKKLTSLYLWNTGIDEKDMESLKKKFAGITIESGYSGDTVIARLNAPLIEGEKQVFKEKMSVKVKHYMSGVAMRYTLDGKDPDSIGSLLYKEPVVIDKSCMLKVKAFLPGWISSDIIAKQFYETGIMADSIRLASQPDNNYRGVGGKTITDGEKSDLNFRNGKWLGYKENDMQAYLYFKQPVSVSSVSISSIVDIGSYIMPPQQIELWGGTNNNNLVLLKKINPQQPSKQQTPYLVGIDGSFPAKNVSVLKIVLKPVSKLPSWHPGKGTKGWVFVDEVFLN
jgi:uncharacterized membrane protein